MMSEPPFEKLERRVAALEEQVAAMTSPDAGLLIKMYRCRDCKLLFGARTGWEPEECPSCSRGSPMEVDALVDVALVEGDDGS